MESHKTALVKLFEAMDQHHLYWFADHRIEIWVHGGLCTNFCC